MKEERQFLSIAISKATEAKEEKFNISTIVHKSKVVTSGRGELVALCHAVPCCAMLCQGT